MEVFDSNSQSSKSIGVFKIQGTLTPVLELASGYLSVYPAESRQEGIAEPLFDRVYGCTDTKTCCLGSLSDPSTLIWYPTVRSLSIFNSVPWSRASMNLCCYCFYEGFGLLGVGLDMG